MGLLDRLIDRPTPTKSEDTDQLQRRLSVIPTPDLALWLDNVLVQTGKAISDHLRQGKPGALEEAKMGVESLRVLIEEVEKRGG